MKTPIIAPSLLSADFSDLRKDIERLDKAPSKGLFVASSAVIPGSGQIFNGFTKDGISSFLYTCLAGLYFGQEIKEENAFGIAFSGFLFVSAYSGNLIGSYKAPERRLNEKRERIKREVIQKVNLNEKMKIDEITKTIPEEGKR